MVVLVVWSGVRTLGSSLDLDHGGTLKKPVLICESAGGLSLSSVSVSACCCWGVSCLLDTKSSPQEQIPRLRQLTWLLHSVPIPQVSSENH